MKMEKPGGLPRNFDKWIDERMAAQRGLRPPATPPFQLSAGSDPVSASARRAFTLQSGGSKVFAEAAERIGSALGSAHRQLRHGLKLVHPAEFGEGSRLHPSEQGPARQTEDDWAARMMQEIETAVAEIRREAAGRLISLQSRAGANLRESREGWRDALSQIRKRALRMASENPARTVAAIAGFCLALGAALRLRRSHP